MITLEIADVPVAPTILLSVHWRHRQRHQELWNQKVLESFTQAGQKLKYPFRAAQVKIDRRSREKLESGNLLVACKPIIDALHSNGILAVKKPEYIEVTITQTRDHHLPARTLIQIQPL